MKQILFIAFCSSLFFQVSCKNKENTSKDIATKCNVIPYEEPRNERDFTRLMPGEAYTPSFQYTVRPHHMKDPLIRSVWAEDAKAAKCLLEAGHNPNAIEKGRDSTYRALYLAISLNQPEIIKLLIKKGANVNEIDPNTGETFLLKRAEFLGDKDILKILKANGAK